MDETIHRKEQLLNGRRRSSAAAYADGRQSRVYQNAVLEVILPPETLGGNETMAGTSTQDMHVPTTTSLVLVDSTPSESASVWSTNTMGAKY